MLSKKIQKNLTDKVVKKVSRSIAADAKKTSKAINKATPMFVSALGRNVQRKSGARALSKAIREDHKGSGLKDLERRIDKIERIEDGRKITEHVFGREKRKTITALTAESGLDNSQIEKLLASIAPVVLDQLGKITTDGNFDVTQLTRLLTDEKRETDVALGGLASLFDTNRNGTLLDEIWNFIKRLFGF
ncbi:MAG: DUF937 domain-containing protein [Candidatus Dojkabacteria bacterium]